MKILHEWHWNPEKPSGTSLPTSKTNCNLRLKLDHIKIFRQSSCILVKRAFICGLTGLLPDDSGDYSEASEMPKNEARWAITHLHS